MPFLQVDTEKCKRDGMCAAVCPAACIGVDAEGLPIEKDGAACIACGHCVAVCPHAALQNSKLPEEPALPVSKDQPTPEALANLVLGRRSVREYTDTPVDPALLAELLDVARRSPTAVNSQKVGWIACCDPARTRATASVCSVWLRESKLMPRYADRWDQGEEVILRGAPAFVLAYAPADYAWGATDCAIALTTLELLAVARGLGTCWAGLLARGIGADTALARAVELPEGHVVHGGLMLGHPKYRYRAVPPRKPLQATWL
jgi:nitroreductase/NAD-dependent dihydropyrimidine dehydrogenase PreA subunit